MYIVTKKLSECTLHFLALGGMNKKLYWSLETVEIQDHTPKLYHLYSVSKKFHATEILCPYRADFTTPFPFSQDDLYQANQPGNDTFLEAHFYLVNILIDLSREKSLYEKF